MKHYLHRSIIMLNNYLNKMFSLSVHSEIEVPFTNDKIAQIAYDVLVVDKEPKRSEVIKVLSTKKNILIAQFSARFARQLRVAVNGFFEKLDLVSGCIELLGPPVSESYSHY
ncbi:EKC/KEOPS complex subunit Lage3-like [Leptinotarsa decemlineata]|uniref:EKC/KEOPS complex subunit Lage3-like n=1 Tax=Leptinotarsa decemlineata TaxID=7539 RepID=UPI003D30D269